MGRFGPSQAVLGHLPLFGSTVGLFQTITAPEKCRFGPIQANSGQFRPFQAISACFQPGKGSFRPTRTGCGLFWSNIGPLQVILGPFGSFLAKKGMFLEASDCFGSLGRTVSGHPKAIKGHLRAVSDYFRPFRARKVPRVILGSIW